MWENDFTGKIRDNFPTFFHILNFVLDPALMGLLSWGSAIIFLLDVEEKAN